MWGVGVPQGSILGPCCLSIKLVFSNSTPISDTEQRDKMCPTKRDNNRKNITKALPIFLGIESSGAHEDSNRGWSVIVGSGRVVEWVSISFIHPQDWWDTGGLDVKDPGVHDLTVDLHHHLKLLVLYQALCNEKQILFVYVHFNHTWWSFTPVCLHFWKSIQL